MSKNGHLISVMIPDALYDRIMAVKEDLAVDTTLRDFVTNALIEAVEKYEMKDQD